MKVYLYCTILLFRLVIYLRLKYSKKLSLDVKEEIKQKQELRHENRSVVIHNRVKKVVMLYYYLDNHFRKS